MKRALTCMLACLCGWSALGCDEPLKSVELIGEPRVLGARVEVAGDAGRAAPGLGETATVSFLVAAPELQPTLGFALAVCASASRRGSRAACAAPPFAQVASDNGQSDSVSITFDVPTELDAERLTLLGIVCVDGSPSAEGASCVGGGSGTPVVLELELEHADDVNQNPELQPDSLLFDADVWPELSVVEGDCAGLGFAEVAVGSKHQLGVVLDESDRDPLPRPTALDPARESLQLSHFTTAGDLSRAFQSIAWDSDELARQVTWTAPEQPGLVRFWLVVRDFRGGSANALRAVCVQ